MIRYIDLYRDQFGVEAICRVLRATERGFITSRGYRAAKTRPASHRQVRDAVLIPILKDIHQANYGVYGVRKMWHSMTRAGWMIGLYRSDGPAPKRRWDHCVSWKRGRRLRQQLGGNS